MKEEEENKGYTFRTINLKLNPTDEVAVLLDEEFEVYSNLHDIGVNRYANLPDKKLFKEEAKRMRQELKTDDTSGTFVDLAIGMKGAEKYFNDLRKKARSEIIRRNTDIKKLEAENPNLLKPESVWFNPVKNVEGICSMCGREGKMPKQSNESKECLCEVCAVDFFAYRANLYDIRRHIKKNYFLCKDLIAKNNLSELLIKEINRFDKPIQEFKGTISNKVKLKSGQTKIDFDAKIAEIHLRTPVKNKTKPKTVQVEFLGEYYYTKFPIYGLDAKKNKFKKLITDFLTEDGTPFLLRVNKNKNGNPYSEYYLSIPTHYPMQNKEIIEGCILISQRRVLLYINGKIKFMELYNPYLKKRIYESRRDEIQGQNSDSCICEWNQIPRKNKMLILNLQRKLGYDWVNEYDISISKSEDGNKIFIKDNNNVNRFIEITINRENGTGALVYKDSSKTSQIPLYIVESKKKPEENKKNKPEENRYRKMEIYIKPQVPMPKKYSDGNLLKHIRHQNKLVARRVVEEAKKMLTDKGSVVLINYTYLHPEKEKITTPIISLNDQIRNMLKYDSIFGGAIRWKRLKNLECPICHTVLPERGEKRLIIRDIFLSKIKSWICEDDNCNRKINSPLLVVARQIMKSDIKELLKKPTKQEKKDDDKDYDNISPIRKEMV